MKKILLTILLCFLILFYLTGCRNKYNGKGTELLQDHGDIILSIERGKKSNCVRVRLSLYEDNKYELFTDYAECRPLENCNAILRYTKSIKGTYDYDLLKIIDDSTNANDKTFSMDNLPEYELYLGEKYIQKYDTLSFIVEKGETNKYLDELLEQLEVDLDSCANPDYVN